MNLPLVKQFSAEALTDGGEILYGVVVAEEGEAKGHGIMIGEEFLNAVVALGNSGPIKVRANHPEKVFAGLNKDGSPRFASQGNILLIAGEAKTFRLDKTNDGKRCVRADVHLFNLPIREQLLQLAHQASHLFGMSVDCGIKVLKTLKGGMQLVTAQTLEAVDFVDNPAATTELFESQVVDSNNNDEGKHAMTLDELAAQLTAHSTKVDTTLAALEKGNKEHEEKMCKMGEMLERYEKAYKWAAAKLEEEEPDDEEGKEKKKKKMEADRLAAESQPVQFTKKQLDEYVASQVSLAAVSAFAKIGKHPTPSNPDATAADDKSRKLSAEEIKMAKTIGITDEAGLKQFAANLEKADALIKNVKL